MASRAPGWPRLMPLRLAALYLGVGESTVLQWLYDGSLAVVQVRRPRTGQAYKHKPSGNTLRRVLVDIRDLDALANGFERVRR